MIKRKLKVSTKKAEKAKSPEKKLSVIPEESSVNVKKPVLKLNRTMKLSKKINDSSSNV